MSPGLRVQLTRVRFPHALEAQSLETITGGRVNRFDSALARPNSVKEQMRLAIDSPCGKPLDGKRLGTAEPVFANLQHNKRPMRSHLQGQATVNAQCQLYGSVHSVETVAHSGWLGVRKVERRSGCRNSRA